MIRFFYVLALAVLVAGCAPDEEELAAIERDVEARQMAAMATNRAELADMKAANLASAERTREKEGTGNRESGTEGLGEAGRDDPIAPAADAKNAENSLKDLRASAAPSNSVVSVSNETAKATSENKKKPTAPPKKTKAQIEKERKAKAEEKYRANLERKRKEKEEFDRIQAETDRIIAERKARKAAEEKPHRDTEAQSEETGPGEVPVAKSSTPSGQSESKPKGLLDGAIEWVENLW